MVIKKDFIPKGKCPKCGTPTRYGQWCALCRELNREHKKYVR